MFVVHFIVRADPMEESLFNKILELNSNWVHKFFNVLSNHTKCMNECNGIK